MSSNTSNASQQHGGFPPRERIGLTAEPASELTNGFMYEERRWGDVLVCLQDVGQMADAHRIVLLDVNSVA